MDTCLGKKRATHVTRFALWLHVCAELQSLYIKEKYCIRTISKVQAAPNKLFLITTFKRDRGGMMFSVTEMRTFELFSVPHITVLLLFGAVSIWMVVFRDVLRPHQSFIKWTLVSILVLSEISAQIWVITTNQWELGNLPLHLCSISTFIAIFLFFNPNKKAFYLLFFIGFLPPILSMVTPEVFYQFPHYRFIKYFLHHSAIAWSVLYFILYEGYRVPKKAVLTGFLLLNLLAVPIYFINLLLDTNFFYLADPTESKTILSFFGSGIWYYINLEIAALLLFFLTYLPMGLLEKRERERKRGLPAPYDN
ncbi:TIGR02206 family membrane protein [Bacillus sp. P14.5]|uniref:YwaF family protein n=1 Tax=Bacillus sp. P14.5 TaxID=1983400 RepID=UPI001F06DC76|nr:TIGR02206 family membrane protein [Bacillus sp. P14.5]